MLLYTRRQKNCPQSLLSSHWEKILPLDNRDELTRKITNNLSVHMRAQLFGYTRPKEVAYSIRTNNNKAYRNNSREKRLKHFSRWHSICGHADARRRGLHRGLKSHDRVREGRHTQSSLSIKLGKIYIGRSIRRNFREIPSRRLTHFFLLHLSPARSMYVPSFAK